MDILVSVVLGKLYLNIATKVGDLHTNVIWGTKLIKLSSGSNSNFLLEQLLNLIDYKKQYVRGILKVLYGEGRQIPAQLTINPLLGLYFGRRLIDLVYLFGEVSVYFLTFEFVQKTGPGTLVEMGVK